MLVTEKAMLVWTNKKNRFTKRQMAKTAKSRGRSSQLESVYAIITLDMYTIPRI